MSTRPTRKKYLIQFAQVHEHFRIPELESVAELYGFKVVLPQDEEERDPWRPWMVVELEREEEVRLLAKRCILIKSVCSITFCSLSLGF